LYNRDQTEFAISLKLRMSLSLLAKARAARSYQGYAIGAAPQRARQPCCGSVPSWAGLVGLRPWDDVPEGWTSHPYPIVNVPARNQNY